MDDKQSKVCVLCKTAFERRGRNYKWWRNAKYCSRKCTDIRAPLEERLLEKIWMEPNSGCWLWTGALGNGYGLILINKKTQTVHRLTYELFVGPIPEGLQLDHLCRVRCCVNPRHLEPVTQQENIARGNGGLHHRVKTHCKHGHEFTPENTRRTPRQRYCKTCSRQRDRSGSMTQKAKIFDCWGQFAKLCPSYSRNIDLTKEQQLEIVECSLSTERSLSDRGHWAYSLNLHVALVELRDALMAECGVREEVAA